MIGGWPLLLLCATLVSGQEVVQTHDFGAVFPSTPLQCDVVFRNDGRSVWIIGALTATCSCSRPTGLPKTVAPGETLAIPVRYRVGTDRRVRVGGDIRVEISGGGDAPSRLVARFTAEAHGLLVLPAGRRVVLPPVPMGSHPTATAVELTRDSHPAAWETVSARVTAGTDALRAEVGPDPERQTWRLLLTPDVGCPAGIIPCRVELTCQHAGETLPFSEPLAVIVRIAGTVRADPPSLLFGAIPAGTRQVLRFRMLPDAATSVPALAGVTVSDAAHCTAAAQSDGSVEVVLDATKVKADQQASGHVELAFADGSRLRVPYFAAFSATP